MPRTSWPPLPLLPALLVLPVLLAGACGGGSTPEQDAEAVYDIAPPDDERDAVIAVKPDGEVVTKQGLTEEDRAAGRTWRARSTSSWTARRARVEAYAGRPWLDVQRALDRVVWSGSSGVELNLHERGASSRTILFTTACMPHDPRPGIQRVRLAFALEDGALRLHVSYSDGAWLRMHGCGAGEGQSWEWADGRALALVRALVLELRAVCGDDLDLRVEVPGLRWPSARPNPEEPEPTLPTVAHVADLIEVLTDAGIGLVDVALHSCGYPPRRRDLVEQGLRWLAAHQSADGAWDADAFLEWCDRKPMQADAPGDGQAHFDVGATSLALLAFLGAGYTDRGRHPFAKTVGPGLRTLKTTQGPEGTYGRPGDADAALQHALATAVLVQAHGMTDSPLWKSSAAQALAALPEVWRAEAADAAATGAAVLAVAAAEDVNTRREKRGKPPVWFLDTAFLAELREGCIALAGRASQIESATGVAGSLLLGEDPADAAFHATLAAALPTEPETITTLDPRVLHLHVLSARRLGGDTFKAWAAALKREFMGRPRQGDHACCFDGSWPMPEGLSLPGGRVEATAAWLLTAELYYRYDRVIK